MSFDTDDTRRRDGDRARADQSQTDPMRPDPVRKVSEDIRQVQDSATRAIHDLRDQAGAAAEEVKLQTGELASTATARVRGIIDEQKSAGAEAIDAMARAAHEAAGQIEQRTPMVARAVHQAAEGAERISRDLRERSVGDLANTVSDFARREPVAFFAGSVLAGLVLARFVKSSASAAQDHADSRDASRARSGVGGEAGGFEVGGDTMGRAHVDPAAHGVG